MARNAPARTPRFKGTADPFVDAVAPPRSNASRCVRCPRRGSKANRGTWIDLRADIRMTFSARRTLFGVDTRDFEKFLTSGLRRGFWGLGRSDQITAARDLCLSSAIGKQPEMTDSHKTLAEDVEQDAAG